MGRIHKPIPLRSSPGPSSPWSWHGTILTFILKGGVVSSITWLQATLLIGCSLPLFTAGEFAIVLFSSLGFSQREYPEIENRVRNDKIHNNPTWTAILCFTRHPPRLWDQIPSATPVLKVYTTYKFQVDNYLVPINKYGQSAAIVILRRAIVLFTRERNLWQAKREIDRPMYQRTHYW